MDRPGASELCDRSSDVAEALQGADTSADTTAAAAATDGAMGRPASRQRCTSSLSNQFRSRSPRARAEWRLEIRDIMSLASSSVRGS